jgi:hypothetical protein
MLNANGLLKLNPGHVIPVFNVTPAEVQLLIAEHKRNAKEQPFTLTEDSVGKIERSPEEERDRLVRKYGPRKVNAMYPLTYFRFPEDFTMAVRIGGQVSLPQQKFMGGEPTEAVLPSSVELGDE